MYLAVLVGLHARAQAQLRADLLERGELIFLGQVQEPTEDIFPLAASPIVRHAGPAADDGAGAAGRASATATLRVTLRQAVYLTAAENLRARCACCRAREAIDGGRVGRR